MSTVFLTDSAGSDVSAPSSSPPALSNPPLITAQRVKTAERALMVLAVLGLTITGAWYIAHRR